MRFRTTLMLGGKTATGLVVPDEVVEQLGSKRAKVVVTINGHVYRSSIAARGDQVLLPVSAEVRAGAGISAGDTVDVDVVLDTQPREVAVPAELAEALAGEPEARAFFEGLAFSHQRAYVDWIESAKKAETREARVVKATEMLRAQQKR